MVWDLLKLPTGDSYNAGRTPLHITKSTSEVIRRMTRIKGWSIALILTAVAAFAFSIASPAAAAPDAADIVKKVQAKWEKTKSYECELFQWGYRTPSFIKNFPEHREEDDKPGWGYRVFAVRFLKPNYAMLRFKKSLNEDLTSGSIIDIAVAHVLAYIPGTTFLYGYEDKSKKIQNNIVYIVFPYISDKKFNALPLPADKKATMKTLMIASRKEFYFKSPEDLKDNRGNLISELSIDKKIAQSLHYFKDGKVTVKEVNIPQESDFTLDKKTGWLTAKKPTGPKGYKLVMVPNSVDKNKGITRTEVFLDKNNVMFVGMMDYEMVSGKEQLVQVMLMSKLKLNVKLSVDDWKGMFKGRKLSNKG